MQWLVYASHAVHMVGYACSTSQQAQAAGSLCTAPAGTPLPAQVQTKGLRVVATAAGVQEEALTFSSAACCCLDLARRLLMVRMSAALSTSASLSPSLEQQQGTVGGGWQGRAECDGCLQRWASSS